MKYTIEQLRKVRKLIKNKRTTREIRDITGVQEPVIASQRRLLSIAQFNDADTLRLIKRKSDEISKRDLTAVMSRERMSHAEAKQIYPDNYQPFKRSGYLGYSPD